MAVPFPVGVDSRPLLPTVRLRLPIFRADDRRSTRARLRSVRGQARAFAVLPPRVRRFYARALWTAWRTRDQYSFDVVTRPRDLTEILRLAGDADRVAELGTATAWTSTALALHRPGRRVITSIPSCTSSARYVALGGAATSGAIEFVRGPGRQGPPDPAARYGFVFVDGSHQAEDTIATYRVWEPVLVPGGRIASHDFGDPTYQGVTDAERELGLVGRVHGRMFIWTKDADSMADVAA